MNCVSVSSFLTLSQRDWIKGLSVAVLSVVIGSLYQIFQSGALPTPEQFNKILVTGGTAALAYIMKNFFTNNQDQMLKKDVPTADITPVAEVKKNLTPPT